MREERVCCPVLAVAAAAEGIVVEEPVFIPDPEAPFAPTVVAIILVDL